MKVEEGQEEPESLRIIMGSQEKDSLIQTIGEYLSHTDVKNLKVEIIVTRNSEWIEHWLTVSMTS